MSATACVECKNASDEKKMAQLDEVILEYREKPGALWLAVGMGWFGGLIGSPVKVVPGEHRRLGRPWVTVHSSPK